MFEVRGAADSTLFDRADRGLSAERIPTGRAISIQTMAPPNTREAETGAALRTVLLTLWRVTNERPRFRWSTSRSMNFRYWIETGRSSPSVCVVFLMQVGVARCPQACLAGFTGIMKKITKVTIVITTKRAHAHRRRRIR